mmetsp:Transcript_39912/g.38469  ORF Transcript_39912/g.38469 Transcript_39912/m.38469 type:complete len:104 (-) Transcript_39912:21-332(-)
MFLQLLDFILLDFTLFLLDPHTFLQHLYLFQKLTALLLELPLLLLIGNEILFQLLHAITHLLLLHLVVAKFLGDGDVFLLDQILLRLHLSYGHSLLALLVLKL